MGIYYYAVDTSSKQFFSAPDDWAIKSPGIYHPENPFPGMVVMKNIQGCHFEIWDDCGYDVPPGSGYEEITENVFKEYKQHFAEYFANKGDDK